MPLSDRILSDKIQSKTSVIGVAGLGYVGLPLAVCFAEAGFPVLGVDTQKSKLDALHESISYIDDVASSRIGDVVKQGRLLPLSWDQVTSADVFIICVPTPITKDKKPDLSYIIETTKQIKSRLLSGDSLVVLESSTYPGTTRDVVLPILGGSAKYVAYSPERVDPGSKKFTIRNTPKLVGGIDAGSTKLAAELYSHIVDTVVPVPTPETAETVKLFENVFRSVNIALVNEMALICERIGVSVWEVIDAAATKPFGFMPFYPGVGVGGSCIPKDPYYLADRADEYGTSTKIIRLALHTNESMPYHIALRLVELLLNQGKKLERSKILVLGIAFKRDIGDIRESAPVELLRILSEQGANVLYNDPYVPRLRRWALSSEELTNELLESVDCVVIATDHSCYDWRRIVDRAQIVFDTRNATKGIASDKIYRLGEGIGKR